MANFSWQLCNSQNVEEIIMNLQYFWKNANKHKFILNVMWFSVNHRNKSEFTIFLKNVNKQLKSADFLSEMSKFQKNYLNKVLAFFILMSEHTLVFVVQPPNGQNCFASILVLLSTPYTYDWFCQGRFCIFH